MLFAPSRLGDVVTHTGEDHVVGGLRIGGAGRAGGVQALPGVPGQVAVHHLVLQTALGGRVEEAIDEARRTFGYEARRTRAAGYARSISGGRRRQDLRVATRVALALDRGIADIHRRRRSR